MELTIETLQTNIIETRDAIGLTQEDFALLCGFSRPTLTDIENRKRAPSLNTLNKISTFTTIGIQHLGKRSYVPSANLREKLQKKYAKDITKSVILDKVPSIPYIMKHKVLKTDFLNEFRERKQILRFIQDNYGWVIKPNSLTTSLKRLDGILIIRPNPDQHKGNIYKKK